MDRGLELAGMTCKWQVEIDPYCRKVLAKHWLDKERFADVRECGKHNLEPVDLVCGGFPCQDLSVAGKRSGLSGERSGLFWELVRIASELHPAWLVLENVPGLFSSNGGRDMGAVLGGLEDAGYSVAWRVLDAQWFGVAQRRRRVFLVCHSDARRAGSVLFEPESGQGHPAAVRKAGKDIAHALDARTGGVSAKENQETLVFDWQSGGQCWTKASDKPTALSSTHTPAVAYALNAHGGGCGRLDSTGETFVGAASDPDRVREVAGLPRGMDGKRYRALGNAVAVPVLEWIGRRIMKAQTEASTLDAQQAGG